MLQPSRCRVFFLAPKDSYVPRLLGIRSVFFRTHCQQLNTTLRVLFDLCHSEYQNAGRVLTHEAIQELVTATADLAFLVRLPKISMAETKNRLAEEIRWWSAWVDEVVAHPVGPATAAAGRGKPHWLKSELENLGITLYGLQTEFQGPESRTTQRIIDNRPVSRASFVKLFKALQLAKSKIDGNAFEKLIAAQVKRPKSSRY